MSTQSLPRSHVAEILSRVVAPEVGDLSPEAARALLRLDFAAKDRRRAHELSVKSGEGSLTDGEKAELEAYLRIEPLIELLWLKARRSLRQAGLDVANPGDE